MARRGPKVQPQRGSENRPAPASHSHEDRAAAQQSSASVHPVEPEDARKTGTSRSVQRRVLGQNVEGEQAHEHPETPAGQHATGSFTGDKSGGKRR